MRRHPAPRRLVPLLALFVLAGVTPPARAHAVARDALAEALRPLEPFARSGLLYDRVLPLAHLERLDGTAAAPALDRATWRQAWSELRRASLGAPAGPELATLDAGARAARLTGLVPLAFFDRAFDRVRPDAFADGTLRVAGGALAAGPASPLAGARAVALAALVAGPVAGGDVTLALDPERFLADDPRPPAALALDPGDGAGPRAIRLGEHVRVRFAAPGAHVLVLSVVRADGSRAEARATLVTTAAAPAPSETLHVVARVPWQGAYGSGDAYVDLAPGHTSLVNPVLVIEGFDLDNSMYWDELYALLDQQNLIETLRADGFDPVVLNFTDSTLPIEENGFVVASLVQQVDSLVAPPTTLALVGASMGGLCSRWALDWLETHGIDTRVRTWISFDGPQAGADIPLGLQYWIQFFASQSTSAADFLTALESPASREMLLYHLTTPAGTTGQADPLRDSLAVHLAALGGWPAHVRRVAIANGSSTRETQGFLPGDQLIRYEYSSLFVAITGDVWAVPNPGSATVFNGSQRIVFSTTSQKVTVSGTLPWDGAPGGYRASMTELDTTSVPYGDIVALHPAHCFIPTVSSLALATSDPFFDVAGTSGLAALTPFDAVYYPVANQEHVTITAENAAWVRAEIEQGVLGVPAPGAGVAALTLAAAPDPFADATRLAFALTRAGDARLRVFDVDGRMRRELASGPLGAGTHALAWDGRDARGAPVPPGVYFARLDAGGRSRTVRLVRLR